MTITQTHLDFWQSKQPRPSWAAGLRRGPEMVSRIDSCINAHAGIRTTETTTANLMVLCRPHHADGTLVDFLERLSVNPGTSVNPRKRAALAKKWRRRLLRNRRGRS